MPALLAALVIGILCSARGAKRLSADVRILYPTARGILAVQKPFMLIVAAPIGLPGPMAKLDGAPINLDRFTFSNSWVLAGKLKATDAIVGDRQATSIWATNISLKSGTHLLRIGDITVSISAQKVTDASGVGLLTSHKWLGKDKSDPGCSSCHEITDAGLGTAKTPVACAGCHDDTSVQVVHSHVPQALAACATCHDPHGTPRPKLLVDEKRVLCSRCHASGHIK